MSAFIAVMDFSFCHFIPILIFFGRLEQKPENVNTGTNYELYKVHDTNENP